MSLLILAFLGVLLYTPTRPVVTAAVTYYVTVLLLNLPVAILTVLLESLVIYWTTMPATPLDTSPPELTM